MSEFSETYAAVYDALYADKDYAAEAAYIAMRLREASSGATTVLEFGSGTGRHARLLADHGFTVTGIERSASMIALARQANRLDHVTFVDGDMRTTGLNRTVDAVIAIFHVICYLCSDEAIIKAFRNARRHLVPGGLFLIDFWYGPAVLIQKPETRYKQVERAGLQVFRTALTRLDVEQGLAIVNYTLFVRAAGESTYSRTDEIHTMRYLFLPELRALLSQSGFRFVEAEEWLTRAPIGSNTWSATVLAAAV